MGLLGDSWEDPRTLSLLSAALAMQQQRGMPGLLAGALTYGGGMAQSREAQRKRQAEEEARMQAAEERGLRMQQLRGLLGDQESARNQAGIDQSLLRGSFGEQAGPTQDGAPLQGRFDPRAFLGGGGSFAGLQQGMGLQAAMTPQAPKVARTIEGRDDQNRPVVFQLDDQGRRIGEVVPQWKDPKQLDTGGQIKFVDPVTLGPMASFGKTNAPDALLLANTTMRGQNMADNRAREANSIQDSMRLLQQQKLSNEVRQQNDQRAASIAGVEDSLNVLDQAIKHPGRKTATGLSSVTDPRNFIPGTEARDFKAIAAQLEGKAFLQAFESLKGGGAITEIEGQKATQAIARLDRAQSDAEYKRALEELQGIMRNGYKRMTGRDYAMPNRSGGASGSWGDEPSLDDLLKKYGGR